METGRKIHVQPRVIAEVAKSQLRQMHWTRMSGSRATREIFHGTGLGLQTSAPFPAAIALRWPGVSGRISPAMEWITQPEIWISLFTLTVLEIILGIDNIVFISILAGKLPRNNKAKRGRPA